MNRPDSIVWTVNQPHEAFNPPSSPKSPNFDSLARQLRRQISENFDTSPIKSSSPLIQPTHELSESGTIREITPSSSPQHSHHNASSSSFYDVVPPNNNTVATLERRFTTRLSSTPRLSIKSTTSKTNSKSITNKNQSLSRSKSLAGLHHGKQELTIFSLVCQQLSRCIHETRTLYNQPIRNATELFTAMDTSKTKYISFKELLSATQRLDLGLHDFQVKAFFEYLTHASEAGNGKISVQVLADAIVHHHRTTNLSNENEQLREYSSRLERQQTQVLHALESMPRVEEVAAPHPHPTPTLQNVTATNENMKKIKKIKKMENQLLLNEAELKRKKNEIKVLQNKVTDLQEKHSFQHKSSETDLISSNQLMHSERKRYKEEIQQLRDSLLLKSEETKKEKEKKAADENKMNLQLQKETNTNKDLISDIAQMTWELENSQNNALQIELDLTTKRKEMEDFKCTTKKEQVSIQSDAGAM
jgi:hypothetical protein